MSRESDNDHHRHNKPGFITCRNATVLVTGSSGLCGSRLVEVLLERGAQHVIAFDIAPPDAILQKRFDHMQTVTCGRITVCSGPQGDLRSDEAVDRAFRLASSLSSSSSSSDHTQQSTSTTETTINVVYHIGALVGPFFDRNTYLGVNYHGTLRILAACKKYKVPRLVYSSSPSTRFTGGSIEGLREEELPMPTQWLAMYAETKAYGEMAVNQAHSADLLTMSVAPHQIYGPHDNLFLPNILETAGNGRLRIFGKGGNRISVCHVDNYVHGCLCGADSLTDVSAPCGGKFYIVTDGPSVDFWHFVNQAVIAMGFTDLYTKVHLPVWLLYTLAYLCSGITALSGRKFKLNPFNVRMLTIHRYFSMDNARRDLHYEPLVSTEDAWPATIAWFRTHWLSAFQEQKQQRKKNGKSV